MRILVVTPTYFPVRGGAEVVIHEVFRRLARVHTVLILTPALSGKLEQEGSLPVRHFQDSVSLFNLRGHRISKGLIPPFSLSAIGALRTAVKDFMPDIINAHYAVSTGLAAVLVQGSLGIPIVLTFIGRDVPGPGTPWGWKYYDRLIAKFASEVSYVSDYCRVAIYGRLNEGQGQTIYGGVDIERFHPDVDGKEMREEFGIQPETTVLFSLQRLSMEKRVDALLQSMPHILKDRSNVKLVIGGTGPDLGKLRKLAKELAVEEKVVFAGYIPDEKLPCYYAMADIFVFNSTYETFGLVLAEAMASGKPIVSVKTTAIPEVVGDGIGGLLVEPSDPLALAQGALRLIKDRNLQAQLGRNGRERAERLFDWNKIAQQYEELLLNVGRPLE
jgi:glycosyltransferase involved in cell wall biosynthesis